MPTQMRPLFFCFVLLLSIRLSAQSSDGLQATDIQQLSSPAEMISYNGPANTVLITKHRQGGIFTYTQEKLRVDSGIVFPAHDKGYWVRMYDTAMPVHLSWFNAALDSTTLDDKPLSMALKYGSVLIDGPAAISRKTNVPPGKMIEFAPRGALYTDDTFKCEAVIKAADMQHVFRGNGYVILGATSAPYVSVCWFGAVADGGFISGKGTDNAEAFERAIFAAQKISDVYIPPSSANRSYRIESTITIGKKLHFFSFRFHGGGTTITFSNQDKASNIFADFKSGSAINIQGSRRVYISNLCVRGLNEAPEKLIGKFNKIVSTDAVDDEHTFMSPGLGRNYAGITTDAEKDNKVWSADVVFEDLQIFNFCVGIGISQAGHLQGDRMRIERCQINYCTYGVSIGNAQNRAVHLKDVDMLRSWCGVTNTKFGNGSGSMFQITGGQWCHVYKAFEIQPSYVAQCSITGLYTEAIGWIGHIGTGSDNTSSVLFDGCYFFMRDEGLSNKSYMDPPLYTMEAHANVTFNSCNFWTGRRYLHMSVASASNGYSGAAITMNGCSILRCTYLHIKGNNTVENTYFNPNANVGNFNRHITADLEGNNRYNTGYFATNVISGSEYRPDSIMSEGQERKIVRTIPRFYKVADVDSKISGINWQADTLFFTYDASLQAGLFRYAMPGDLIGGTVKGDDDDYDNPVMRLISVDSNSHVVTATGFTNKVSFSKLAIYTTCFFTTKPMYGTLTSGATSITNITNLDKLTAGDFITFKGATHTYRIASVDTATQTAQLLTPVTENVSGNIELYNQQLVSVTTAPPTK